jgi:hypothetical protein
VALSDEDKATIRALRAQDPETWTQRALAARFQCSRLLIAMVAPRAASAAQTYARARPPRLARVRVRVGNQCRRCMPRPPPVEAQRRQRRSLRVQAAALRRQRVRDALADPSQHGL